MDNVQKILKALTMEGVFLLWTYDGQVAEDDKKEDRFTWYERSQVDGRTMVTFQEWTEDIHDMLEAGWVKFGSSEGCFPDQVRGLHYRDNAIRLTDRGKKAVESKQGAEELDADLKVVRKEALSQESIKKYGEDITQNFVELGEGS